MIFSLSLLFLLPLASFAAPSPSSQPISITLHRKRSPPNRSVKWLQNHAQHLRNKYGAPSSSSSTTRRRRAAGINELVNQNTDSSYYGSLAVGTPPVAFNVILDTGSADLWLADATCTACGPVPVFNSTSSSTFKNLTRDFSITYGSGQAAGFLGQDTVQMAGFLIEKQTFAICDDVSQGLLANPVSGLLGLGFSTLATSGAVPFWQALSNSGSLTQNLFSFYLTRFLNDPLAATEEPGGQFMLGGTNTSLYTGDIDFVSIPDGFASYWILPLQTVTVQGNSLTVPANTESHAAIDTGTTLIGGPADAIASIYAQIPGSVRGSGDYESYWLYPCSTDVNIAFNFGGQTWSIDPADFALTQVTRSSCVGAFFELATGTGAPSWIVGDTFLKNVYSVFRANPPSVGFAKLSPQVKSLYAASDPLPTATIGRAATVATGASVLGGGAGTENGAVAIGGGVRNAQWAVVLAAIVVGVLVR